MAVMSGMIHYTDFITFHYDSLRRNWLFHNEIYTDSQPTLENPPKPEITSIARADKKHPVSFTDWRPDNWCADGDHPNDSSCQNRTHGKGKHS